MEVGPSSMSQYAVEALQSQTQQKVGMEVLKSQAQSEQAVASMISEQAAQLSSQAYNSEGKMMSNTGGAGVDLRM